MKLLLAVLFLVGAAWGNLYPSPAVLNFLSESFNLSNVSAPDCATVKTALDLNGPYRFNATINTLGLDAQAFSADVVGCTADFLIPFSVPLSNDDFVISVDSTFDFSAFGLGDLVRLLDLARPYAFNASLSVNDLSPGLTLAAGASTRVSGAVWVSALFNTTDVISLLTTNCSTQAIPIFAYQIIDGLAEVRVLLTYDLTIACPAAAANPTRTALIVVSVVFALCGVIVALLFFSGIFRLPRIEAPPPTAPFRLGRRVL